MKQYLDLLQDVLDNGTVRDDRNRSEVCIFMCIK